MCKGQWSVTVFGDKNNVLKAYSQVKVSWNKVIFG